MFAASGGNPLLLARARPRRRRACRRAGRDRRRGAGRGGRAARGRAPARAGRGGRGRPVRARPGGGHRRPRREPRCRAGRPRTAELAGGRGAVARRRDPRRFAFRHPVVRGAVYEALGSGARLAGHAAAARALAATDATLPVRAHHLAYAAAAGDAEAAAVSARRRRRPRPGAGRRGGLAAGRAARRPGGADLGALAETLVEAGRLTAALALVDEAGAGPRPADGRRRGERRTAARPPRRGAPPPASRARRGARRR